MKGYTKWLFNSIHSQFGRLLSINHILVSFIQVLCHGVEGTFSFYLDIPLERNYNYDLSSQDSQNRLMFVPIPLTYVCF